MQTPHPVQLAPQGSGARTLNRFAIATACVIAHAQAMGQESQPTDPAPAVTPATEIETVEFQLESLGGRSLRSAELSKQVLLIDCFGTWSPPCRESVSVLVDLHRKYTHHGLEIIGIAFERVDGDEAIDVVRKFAKEHGITYPLTLGTEGLREQFDVKSFPTVVRVGKGLRVDGIDHGFDPEDAAKLEVFVRSHLGLDTSTAAIDGEAGPEPVPAGKLFKPGNGDTGFAFEAVTIQGDELSMESLRGKPLLLAVTSSWDDSAEATADQLQAWHEEFAKDGDVAIVAASFEQAREDEAKREALAAFATAQGIKYPAFAIGLPFTRKLHRWSSLPTWLLFDAEGKLVLRETGLADEVTAALEARLKGQ